MILWPRVILPIGWMMAIFVLSAQPADRLSQLPPLFPHADKVVHAVLYGVLLWLFRSTFASSVSSRCWVPASLGLTFGYALIDEYHQSFVPGRSPDIADLVADLFGAVLATVLLVVAARIRGRGASPGHRV